MSIKSFANGLVIGLVLGVLFAPDSGDETRKKIARKASDIKDTVADKYNDIAETVADKYSKVKSKAMDMMGKGDNIYSGAPSPTPAPNEATNMFE